MPQRLIYMSGLEFMTKIVIDGERNFAGIRLEEGFDLSGDKDYKAFQKYLKSVNHLSIKERKQNPYIFSDSSLRGLKAIRLCLPYQIEAQNADFSCADLQEVDFYGGNFVGASFTAANLIGAYFERSNCCGASFEGANLMKTNLKYANLQNCNFRTAHLQGTHLEEADLRGARNLAEALSFDGVRLRNVKIYARDALKIIDKTTFFECKILGSN